MGVFIVTTPVSALRAPGASPRTELELLARYVALNPSTTCRFGNDACPSSRPADVSGRVRMYAEDYGDARIAREEHVRRAVPLKASFTGVLPIISTRRASGY